MRRRGWRCRSPLLSAGSSVVVGLICFAVAMPADAGVGPGATCAHGGNPTSSASVNGQGNERYYGSFDNFDDNDMTSDLAAIAGGNHVNNETWLYTHSDESQWVEFGIRQGYFPGSPGSCSGYPCAYGRFWADFDSSGNEYRHIVSFTTPTGANHTYEIARDASNHDYWDLYLDYNLVGQSTNQGSSTGYEIQVGLEDSLVTPDTSAATFNHSPLRYENTTGSWVDWPYLETWIDYGCNLNPTGYCLNGDPNGTTIWLDNKP